MLKSGWTLLAKHGFLGDIGMTVWRVLGGFVIAAVLAVPLGVLMGAYKPVEAFFEPFVSFARYLPASAFIPLLILWAGIGEAQKLAVIFIGSFFQLVLMIAVSVGNTRRDLVEAAYTLGALDARRRQAGAAALQRAGDRRDAAHGAGLGLDLRDRRRADRRLQRHRPHDHRQPGAAGHRPDHLRHHRHRPDRAGHRLRLQGLQPEACSHGPRSADEHPAGQRRRQDLPGAGGGTVALQATDLLVQENDFITILGPSGCGKSTLLRMVAGLDTPTGGVITLDGQPVRGPGADRGMVFQSYTLFPWLTVLQNVCFGLREKGMPGAAARRSRAASSPRWA